MKTRTSFLFLAMSLAIVTVCASPAHADLAPPDACTSPGQPCQNAGTQHNQAGTCMATTCTRTVPAGGDGGTTTMTYDCNLCRTVDGGTSGGGNSSGCAIAAGGPAQAAGGSLMVLALVAIALGRRRPSR